MTDGGVEVESVSAADSYWNDLNEELQERGVIPDSHRLTSVDVSLNADDVVTVSNIKSRKVFK